VQAIDIAGVAGGRVSKRLDCTLGMIAREECLVKSKYEWESFGTEAIRRGKKEGEELGADC
jgi:hypothetical protein